MKKSQKHIKDILTSFHQAINAAIQEVLTESNVLLGYRSKEFQFNLSRIKRSIAQANELLQNYSALLDIESSKQLANEIKPLLGMAADKVLNHLKIKFLEVKDISLPSFPMKRDKLAEVYDYTADDLELMESIADTCAKVTKPDLFDSLKDYCNTATGLYEFTSTHEASLVKEHTVYATSDELNKLVYLHLLTLGLTELKPAGWSFRLLPELPHEIVRYLRIDYSATSTRDTRDEKGVSVDLSAFNNPKGTASEITDELNRGIQIKVND